MASLGTNDKQVLEKPFQMGGGYVLNFSDRTFGEFFRDDLSVDIYDQQYNYASGSKANRLRGFWQIAHDPFVAQSIEKLIDYLETQILLGRLNSRDFPGELLQRGHEIAARLQGSAAGIIGTGTEAVRSSAPKQDFYLYTCSSSSSTINSGNVFYQVTGADLADTLRRLFLKEYSLGDDDRSFFVKSADEIEAEERILLEEAIDHLDLYDDPDPYIYDPPPSGETMLRAHFARRAQEWEARVPQPNRSPAKTPEERNVTRIQAGSSLGTQGSTASGAGHVGTIIHGDQYIYNGPIGAIGPQAVGTVNTFEQCWQRMEADIDLAELATELAQLRSELLKTAGNREAIVELGMLAEAEGEAQSGNGVGVMKALSRIGRAVWETAKRIGTDVAAKVIVEASKP